MTLALVVIAAFGGLIWWRQRWTRAISTRADGRHPRDHNGIVIGGEGFVLERTGAPAVLLIHGAGDTPQTLRYLADALFARGFHVAAPLLPGHGRTIHEFSRITADDLTAAARATYSELTAHHEWVAIVGLSMGGALAAQLAADNTTLPALSLVAPYLAMPREIEWTARLAPVWGVLVPALASRGDNSVLDPEERARNLAYGVFTPGALRALRGTVRRGAAALPRITAPTLFVQSRTDNRISVAAAEHAFAQLGARDKRLEWITGAAHVITVDYGHDRVIASIVSWIEARAPVRA